MKLTASKLCYSFASMASSSQMHQAPCGSHLIRSFSLRTGPLFLLVLGLLCVGLQLELVLIVRLTVEKHHGVATESSLTSTEI